ncbi:glycosyl hydrolase family 95 catalytic domain-containing protein [Microbispora sp. H13382]|uniref:glycosyl hydrolase family 95 catalytic domain-containing protein n=1 Tax=Microbispora sp. H13382 TaxID=2729112 RepID=UPI002872BE84|nr:glycoside hydrolase N-terminal domain-containing protein [Microbispora sp. H13382]
MDQGVNGFVSRTRTGDWEHALISGNGRQGALVYGTGPEMRVTLSHERLFLPTLPPIDPPETARILPELRALLHEGEFRRAAERVMEVAVEQDPGYADLRWVDPLIGAGTLTYTHGTAPEGYERSCDFTTGLVTQEWPGVLRQEVFVSRARDVVVIRLLGDVSGTLALAPVGGEPPAPVAYATQVAPDRLELRAEFSRQGGVTGYTVECRVHTEDGRLRAGGGVLEVRGAREVTILARTVVHPAPAEPCPLDRIVPDAARLLRDHAAIHGDLSGRVRLRLGGRDARPRSEDLLARGGPELVEAVFAAARYAIVSSVGELPPTLQGVWSGTFRPPWQSGYTLDGNLQAAVAGLLVTGTPELLLPVFDLLERLLPDFRDNARRLYGCRGILVPAHVSTHGRHNHFHPTWCLTFWTAGAAWLSRLYYDYYDHTGDLGFLRERALPFMTEAAEFYEDFLDEHGNFAPSYSPENAPSGGDAQACVNATMDIAAVRDLLRNLVRAHGESSLDARRWQALRDRLSAYRIAPTGELSEWAPPPGLTLEDDHAHRHASHLYPFWYDTGEAADPALRAAGAEAVRRRLEWWRGAESDEMAFGLVQLGLAAANLGMAAEASQALDLLVTRYWRANMVSTHNRDAIFNVDVCGGVPALVAAMLVRSEGDRLDLLPACPWPSGEVRGLRARHGVVVERLTWSPEGVEAVLAGAASRRLTVTTPRTRR